MFLVGDNWNGGLNKLSLRVFDNIGAAKLYAYQLADEKHMGNAGWIEIREITDKQCKLLRNWDTVPAVWDENSGMYIRK